MEDTDTVLRREVLFTRIEDFGIGISPLECIGNLMHVTFESDYHGLVGQSEAFHLESTDAHDKRLSGSHGMVDDTAAVLYQHPSGVLLAVIQRRDTQTFQVKERECLVRTIIGGTHETVELMVVPVRKFLFKFG